jgi:hypothetical protein
VENLESEADLHSIMQGGLSRAEQAFVQAAQQSRKRFSIGCWLQGSVHLQCKQPYFVPAEKFMSLEENLVLLNTHVGERIHAR